MVKANSIWWERCAALCALTALLIAIVTGISCNGQDLVFQGEFPTGTPVTTTTPTETPEPTFDEGI